MSNEKMENTKQSNKTRTYLWVLLLGVALTVWAMFFKDNNEPLEFVEEDETMEEENMDEEGSAGVVSGASGSYLEGRLENSDDLVQGNYKLVSNFGQIYIKTNRDFNSLVGSDVLVSIDGTMESFTLLDIERRVEKDGYIQQ